MVDDTTARRPTSLVGVEGEYPYARLLSARPFGPVVVVLADGRDLRLVEDHASPKGASR
jgi:hypothetical protein